MSRDMHRLDCHVQTYDWGKRGQNSEVARLYAAGHDQFQINKEMSYAELWMGTHPHGPARIQKTAVDLSRHRAIYEGSARDSDEEHLPFIMKIMSIKHTLSLQVHPTKAQAARLHELDPHNYPDRNHKPELAYALTRFELLCGFRPVDEIVQNMKAFPELVQLMGEENCRNFEILATHGVAPEGALFRAALKECFIQMIYTPADSPLLARCLAGLKERLLCGVRGCLVEDTTQVVLKTMDLFPGDVGCFAPLYLNHMILQPGECCFYAAEELHAYLSGECVECVGCSNNTIRAGLTKKYVDRESLVEVLNYRMTAPSDYLVPGVKVSGFPHVAEYAPDCRDFTLHEIKVGASSAAVPTTSEVRLPALECGSIMVIVAGEAGLERGAAAKRGDIFYIPPASAVSLWTGPGRELLAYRTFSFEEGPDHSSRIQTGSHALSAATLKQRLKLEQEAALNNNQIVDVSVEMDGFI